MLFSQQLTPLLLGAAAGLVTADGIYPKNSPVLQVTAKSYDSLIAQSNHTSIVEFYAPWCGHCQNLKPAYEKAAKNLAGLAKVAAVNCDDDDNKPFCGQMGVQGFPTLKIVRPGSKKGKPAVEDYQGARSAKAIVDAVVDKIPNHVKKLDDGNIEAWLSDSSVDHKVMLFTDKGTTSALLRALAIDYLGVVNVGQVRKKEIQAVERYGVTKFPTMVLVTGSEQTPITYDGEMKKEAITAFMKQVAQPNPDPAPKKAKSSSKKAKSASSDTTASSKFAKASESHKSADFKDSMKSSATVILEDNVPTESPLPNVGDEQEPMVVKEAPPPIEKLASPEELSRLCLAAKSGTCVLLLLPVGETESEDVTQAMNSFAELAAKHKGRQASIFPTYAIMPENAVNPKLRKTLTLKPTSELDIVAINMKRKWWRPYLAPSNDEQSVENFIDAIKLGEGQKEKLPSDFVTLVGSEADTATTSTLIVEPEEQPADTPAHNEL